MDRTKEGGKKFVLVLQETVPFDGSDGGGLNCSNHFEIRNSGKSGFRVFTFAIVHSKLYLKLEVR